MFLCQECMNLREVTPKLLEQKVAIGRLQSQSELPHVSLSPWNWPQSWPITYLRFFCLFVLLFICFYFKLTFIQSKRYGSSFILPHMETQLSQKHLLERLVSFSNIRLWTPLSKDVTVWVCGWVVHPAAWVCVSASAQCHAAFVSIALQYNLRLGATIASELFVLIMTALEMQGPLCSWGSIERQAKLGGKGGDAEGSPPLVNLFEALASSRARIPG